MKKILIFLNLCLICFTLNMVYKQNKIIVFCNAEQQEFADNRVIVTIKNSSEFNDKTYIPNDFADVNCIFVKEISYGAEKMNLNSNKTLCLELNEHSKENVIKVIELLNKRNDVLYAEPDYILELTSSNMLANTISQNGSWYMDNLNLDECWNITQGSSDVIVGIIDSGIDGTHPALLSSLDTTLSHDFTSEISNNSLTDEYIHGTHVAGIIAADFNESNNTSGISPNVTIASLKVCNSSEVPISNVVSAINYAEFKQIPILNFSGGWYSLGDYYLSLTNAISGYSGLLVCSSGNDNKNIDQKLFYPACLNCENIITVGAYEDHEYRWIENDAGDIDGSNYGNNNVDIYAPGYYINNTVPNGYAYKSGTSMAAPFVSGLAALLLSIKPDLTPIEIKNIILSSADVHNMRFDCLDSNSMINISVKKINPLIALKSMMLPNIFSQFELNNSLTYEYNVSNNINNLFIKLNVKNENIYDITITGSNQLDVSLFDNELNYIDIHEHSESNYTILKLSVTLSVEDYVLNLMIPEFYTGDYVSISIQPHSHDYTCKHQWMNSTLHKNYCCCNSYQTAGHAVLQGSNVCIICKGTANIGFVGPGLLNNLLYRTINGSYILENGVIVLNEEDVDDYLNNNLEFYLIKDNNQEVR